MIKGIKELTENLPKALTAVGGVSPDWLTKLDSIVKGVNDMINFYNQLSKTPSPASLASNNSEKMTFSEAREAKKAEMAEKKGKAVIVQPVAGNEFKEILDGLIKACKTLEGMGFKEKPIGQVILSLPVTLAQTKDFLEKLYKSKYGVSNG